MDIGSFILDGNPDAVEFCPHDSFHNVLAASTYVLQEGDSPSRSGCITLFDVDDGKLELIQKVETAGIFDIKWSPLLSGNPLLAQADADGCVKVYNLQSQCSVSDVPGNYSLNEVDGKCISSSSSMCLCIDWNPSATSMAIGLSDGSVSVISSELKILQEWKAHDFEVWASSFDIQQPTLLYTGSDDCSFICWDLRSSSSSQFVFQNRKSHKMGVCCIAKSPHDTNVLLTGSYDECLRIWDVRSTSTPVIESWIGLGGGVWRIKHHPSIPGLALTACMHNGFAIVKFGGGGEVEIVETYKKHDSLAYGADWQRGRGKTVATCSFYDRLLRVWTPLFL